MFSTSKERFLLKLGWGEELNLKDTPFLLKDFPNSIFWKVLISFINKALEQKRFFGDFEIKTLDVFFNNV